MASYYDASKIPSDRRPHIAFAGRSNVGKSTLLNAVIGRRSMAKVSSTPGKTKSINLFLINERFYLADLPGYGYAKVSKSISAGWKKLIESYLTQQVSLSGLVLLLDSRRELTDDDLMLIEWLTERQLPVLVVVTKADKLNRDKIKRKVHDLEAQLGTAVIAFSSVTGLGKKELRGAINDLVTTHYTKSRK